LALRSFWYSRLRRRWPVVILIALLALMAANYGIATTAIGENDFLPYWTAGRAWLSEGTNPYDPSVSTEAQTMIYGRPAIEEAGEALALNLYPLWAMILYVPLSLLPYPLAFAMWLTWLEVGLPLVVWLSVQLARWKAPARILAGMMVFAIFSYHGLQAIVAGQFAIIEALLVVAGLLAIQRGMDIQGGILLALSLIKPHLTLFLLVFVILWAVSKRRWPLLVSASTAPLLLLGLSFLLSRDWMLMWLRSLVTFMNSTDARPPLIAAGSGAGAAGLGIAWGLFAALAVYMVAEWFRALGKEDHWFQWTAALTLVITSLITVRTTTTNMVLLIPALVLIFKVWLDRSRSEGIRSALIAGGLLMAGLWVLYLLTLARAEEHLILSFPVPVFAMIGLLWSRWWTTSGPGVLVQSDMFAWD
jgi:hypothetical protein